MKPLLLLCCLVFCTCAFCQKTGESWYKMLQGKIGNYGVTLHLHKFGHQYAGYYYYHTRQQPLYFSGEDTSQQGKINIQVFTSGSDSYEQFIFSIAGDKATGNWKRSETATPLPFSASEIKTEPSFEYVYTQGTFTLKPEMENSPSASFQAGGVWANGSTPGALALQKEVRFFFTKNTSAETFDNLLMSQKQAFFATYKKETADLKSEDLKETPSMYARDEILRALIAYGDHSLISLAFSAYTFSGGAHGNYGTRFSSIHLSSGKKLQVADVLTPEGEKVLPHLLAEAFRKLFGLKNTEKLTEGGLFANAIKPTDNFFITGKGVGFNYVPYEIGPYALGEILLFIPYESLTKYLQPTFVELLKKK